MASRERLSAKVIQVSDGDTLKARCGDGETITVRLCSIDTPEKSQPHGLEAKEALARMVLNRSVRIEHSGADRYGRVVGKIFRGRTFVNEEMVRHGHAWVYHDYSSEPGFARLEDRARKGRKGLWALPESQRIPPWDWRKGGGRRGHEARIEAEASARQGRRWLWGTGVFTVGLLVAGLYVWPLDLQGAWDTVKLGELARQGLDGLWRGLQWLWAAAWEWVAAEPSA